MENQINIGGQNNQQINQNPVKQLVILYKNPKFVLILSLFILLVLLSSAGVLFLTYMRRSFKDLSQKIPSQGHPLTIPSDSVKTSLETVAQKTPFITTTISTDSVISYATNNAIWVSTRNGGSIKKLLWTSRNAEQINSIKWSPDGNKLVFYIMFATGDPDNGLYLFDGIKNKVVFITKSWSSRAGTWSHEGKYYVYMERSSFDDNGEIIVFNTESYESSIIPNISEFRKGEVIYPDVVGNIYNDMETPLIYCRGTNTECVSFIAQVNLNNKEITQKILSRNYGVKGGISGFLLDSTHNQILYSGTDDQVDDIFRYDLVSRNDSKIDLNFQLENILYDNIEISPNSNNFAFTKFLHGGGSTSYIVSLINFSSTNLDSTQLGEIVIHGWIDNQNLLVSPIDRKSLWELNIDNLKLTKLFDANSGLFTAATRLLD